ncbi:MAG: hypothetical protein OK457_04755 [Thaumarchaeota archaeon]|nr:hypothetical protein [Nitrososphaerota archaeon]
MTRVEECPKCKKAGSFHLKTVYNNRHRPYKYYSIAHYGGLSGKTRKIAWCYVVKEIPTGSPVIANKLERGDYLTHVGQTTNTIRWWDVNVFT